MMKIGAQLYTVRDFCKDLNGFADTLAKVAEMGYTTVQVSGTCKYPAEWLKGQLDKNGLTCVLTHIPAADLVGETDQVIKDHQIFGCDYIGLGYYPFKEDKEKPEEGYDYFMDTYLPVAKKIAEAGKYMMYHNHDQEFQKRGDRIILEHLRERFPKEQLGFTLDTFWIQAGGGDPAQWIERLSGRVPCIHLKDYAYGRKMAVIGEGNINFDRVFEKAEAAGTQYMLVEQDDCNGEDPFDCLRRSYENLRSWGFR